MRSKSILLAFGVAAGLFAVGFQGSGDGFKRERSGETAAKKDALEGKAPPELQVSELLNTTAKKLTWKDLQGKVVVLDFWAHW